MIEVLFFFCATTLTCYAVRVQRREEQAWREQECLARSGMSVAEPRLVRAAWVGRGSDVGGSP